MPGQPRSLEKLDNPQALGEEENEVEQTKFSGVQTEPASLIVNVTSAEMPDMNPTLAYVFLKVSHNKWSEPTEVRALHDSGCAATTMSTQAFMKLTNSDKITLSQPTKPILVQSCTGELTQTRGLAELDLQFKGENGNFILIRHRVIICDKIDFDLILGRDITGSSIKKAETNDYLYLSEQNEKIHNLPEYLLTNKHKLVDVPISNRSQNSFDVCTTQNILIEPFSMVSIPCQISKDNKPLPVLIGKGAVLFEVVAVNVSDLCPMRNTVLAYTNPSELSIPLYNDSNDSYILPADVTLAQIEHFSHELPMYEMQMKTLNGEIYQLNNIQPSFIKDDDYMSEEEKEAAFVDFAEKGFFQPSMSYLIEEAPAITELELKNVEPYPEHIFEDLFKLSHLPKHQQKEAKRILKKHRAAFSKHDQDIGKVNCIEMDIQIDETKPRIQKYVPIPHAARPQVRQILDQMEDYNIIRECNEPSLFCSNLLVIPKKDKKLLRILLDGRLLNNATIRQPTNLVNSAEIKMFLTNKDWITTFDVSHAFYQIPLSEKSQPLTAFYSEAHGKRYCFMRAPQGLKNSPLQLKLLMDKMFGHMCNDVIHYADDIMIATKGTFAEHLQVLSKVLEQMEKTNLLINPKKVYLAQESIEFLGIVWKKGTLHVPEAKLSAFKNYPIPTTPKRTKSFVCAMSYYRQFIPRYAALSKPLMDLALLHPKQFIWDKSHQKSFDKMIKSLIEHSSLYLPQPDKPFFVQTDASDVCGAGRVYQKNELGEEMLIACISRTFTRAERKYGAFKKEVLALLYTLKSMDFFLRYANQITILVDAKAIVFLRLCKESSGILLRFSIEISKYPAEIHHVSGEHNFISDILSRHNVGIDDILQEKKTNYLSEEQTEHILKRLSIPEQKKFSKEEVAYMLEAESLINPIPKKAKKSTAKPGKRVFPNMPETLHERKIKMPKESFRRPGILLPTCSCSPFQINSCNHPTMNYDELKNITQVLIGGKITTKMFIQMQQADENCQKIMELVPRSKLFHFREKVLYFGTKRPKPVMPDALLDLLIQSKHYTVFGQHNSTSRIKRDIHSVYHVTRKLLGTKLQMLKTNCLVCQFNKTNTEAHTLKQTDFRKAPQTCWAIDIIPNLPLTKNANKAVFLAIDMFTGFVSLAPLKSRKTEDLIQAFTATILNPFKIPLIVRCDNETGMANSVDFTKFFETLGTRFEPTSTASPWSNGAAERAVQTIKESLRKFTMQEHIEDNWDENLHFFNGAHNSSTSVYGFAPNELHFGYNLPKQTDLLQFWPNAKSQQEYMDLIVPLANEARDAAKEKAIRENDRVLTYRNKNRATKTFKIGEVVLHKQLQHATGSNMCFKPKFTGPYVIVSIGKDKASAIVENLQNGRTAKMSFTNLQLFSYHPNFSKLPADFDEQMYKHMPLKNSKEKYFSQEENDSEEFEENKEFFETDQGQEDLANDDFDFDSHLHQQQIDLIENSTQDNTQNQIGTCITCYNKFDKCTCVPITQLIDDKSNAPRNINFGNNINNILSKDCIDHPDPCFCMFNDSNEYGYRSEYEFDPKIKPNKTCLTNSDKYGKFIPPIFRPHKVCEQTGLIVNDYETKAKTIYEDAKEGIVNFDIDPNKYKVTIIQDDTLPLGIINNVPSDLYHKTLNPNPIGSTDAKDLQSRTEETDKEEDSGIQMDTNEDSAKTFYNLRKRKTTSYKEVKDYKPRSNSRTDKKQKKENDQDNNSRTEDSQNPKINSLSITTFTTEEEERLKFLTQFHQFMNERGLTFPSEMNTERCLLQMKKQNVPETLTNISTKENQRLKELIHQYNCNLSHGVHLSPEQFEEMNLIEEKKLKGPQFPKDQQKRLNYYSDKY